MKNPWGKIGVDGMLAFVPPSQVYILFLPTLNYCNYLLYIIHIEYVPNQSLVAELCGALDSLVALCLCGTVLLTGALRRVAGSSRTLRMPS